MDEPKSREVVDIGFDSESESGVDFQWIRNLLDEDEDEDEDEDDDDDDDDDDCVLLDGDPDAYKGVSEPESEPDDDLVVVASKGEVACRDFPHPRHLCVKFPFSSSRHEVNCDQCYCYVCDSVAPCVYWGTGVSRFDHCHATDKERYWKSQRTSLRTVQVSLPPVHNIASSSMTKQLITLTFDQFVHHQLMMRRTNTLVPQGSHLGSVLPGSNYPTHLISQTLGDMSPLVSLTNGLHDNCNLGTQRAVFGRTGTSALASSDRSELSPSCLGYSPPLPTNPPVTPRWHGSHCGIMTSGSHAYPQTDPVLGNTMCPPQMLYQKSSDDGNDILSRQHMNSGFTNYRHQTYSHFPVNGVPENSVPPGFTNYRRQAYSHFPVNGVPENSVPPQQPVSSHTPGNGNFRASFVSGTQACYQQDSAYGFMNKTPTLPQLTNLPQWNEGRNTEFLEAARTEARRQLEADTESLKFHLTNARSSSTLNSHGNIQHRNQNAEQADHFSANMNFYHQHASLAKFGTTDLEAWLLVDHSIPQSHGISVPLLNTPIPSPEPSSLDGGGLFFD